VEKGDYPKALADVEQRLKMQPPDPMALLARGNLHALLEEREAALADFTQFLRLQPKTVLALRARGHNYTCMGRYEEALIDLDKAQRLEPANAEVYYDRGRAYQIQGSYQAALADFQKALALAPDEAGFHNQLAWLLAACPAPGIRNGRRAVELARRGCELSQWQEGNLLDTLACAHAECGQFDEAMKFATQALERASAETKEIIRGHVELFRQRRPVRIERR
jgi:tetratricopeptide (TPR) repeat protein